MLGCIGHDQMILVATILSPAQSPSLFLTVQLISPADVYGAATLCQLHMGVNERALLSSQVELRQASQDVGTTWLERFYDLEMSPVP